MTIAAISAKPKRYSHCFTLFISQASPFCVDFRRDYPQLAAEFKKKRRRQDRSFAFCFSFSSPARQLAQGIIPLAAIA
jgi:hypothetical protein